MNPEEFLRYLADHKGEAYVGNPETLQVAKQMEKAKLLDEVGQKDGKPYYRLTEKGILFVGYSLKRLPGQTDRHARTKSALKSIGNAVDGYIQAFKAENPVGAEDIRRTMSIFSSGSKAPDEDFFRLPDVEPMQLEADKPKQLSQKKAKPKAEEYIIVDGKKYKKVD
jgi:hypothetical protein